MVMCISAARQAMPGRVVRGAIPGRVVRLANHPGAAQPAMRPSASASAPARTVRTQARDGGQPKPTAPSDLTMTLATGAVVVTIIGGLQAIVINNISALESKQTASIREVAASISEVKSEQNASIREVAASIRELKSELTANTASSREVNTKLDALGANVQAQQLQTADLKGQVGVLRDTKK